MGFATLRTLTRNDALATLSSYIRSNTLHTASTPDAFHQGKQAVTKFWKEAGRDGEPAWSMRIPVFIEGVHPNRPGRRIVGRAKTLRFVAYRPDLFDRHGGGYNAQKQAFDTVNAGDVLVIEARGERGTGTVGDVLALRAQVRGAAGIVTDGGVRDADAIAEFDIPVFSQGPHPSVLGRRHVPWETDGTITCGGAAVQPGDVIVGDGDGVIVIPPTLVEEIAAEAVAQEREEAWVAGQVAAGASVDGLFPMDAVWRARYRAETETR